MLKYKMYVISIVGMCLLVGCGNSNIDNITIEQNSSEIQDSISYEEYSGYWSYEGKTQEQILAEGGIELSCTITGDNQFLGTLFVQQEITQRFASIEDISGEIEQAELYFDYSDDEWGNSGTLHIQFLNESVFVEVLNYKEAENGSDYGINGSFELIREKEDVEEENIPVYPNYNSLWTEEEDDSDGINRNYNAEDYMKYKVQSSYFWKEDLKGYELVISQADEDEDYVRDVKVFVSKLEDETYVLMQVLEDKLHDGDAWDSEGLHLVDVNFDGEKDILVQNGHYGNQGTEYYSCYLYHNGSYQQCDSFSEIPNASVDAQNQYMLGSWRNSAASHGYGIYLFENGRYRLWRMLTLEFLPDETAEDEGDRVLWLDEEYDGDNVSLMNIENATITEQFSIEADYESDIVQEKFLGPESFWKLDDYDRWNSFHPRDEVIEED